MKTEAEAIHFLKGAEVVTGGSCFVRPVVNRAGRVRWKIFVSEDDYKRYVEHGVHNRRRQTDHEKRGG